MNPLSIHVDSDTPCGIRALAASLPASIVLSEHSGDLILIDTDVDWTERLCEHMASGRRRFLVLDPVLPDAEQLNRALAMARQTSSQVAISETHADNPAVAPFRALSAGPYTTVTLVGHGTRSTADMLLQQLRLARRTGFACLSVVHTLCDARAGLVTLRVSRDGEPALMRLSVAKSLAGSPQHRLMAQSATETACRGVGSAPTARPARAFRVDEESETVLPTLYESAHRAVLRSLAQGVDGAERRDDLAAWCEDAALARSLAAL